MGEQDLPEEIRRYLGIEDPNKPSPELEEATKRLQAETDKMQEELKVALDRAATSNAIKKATPADILAHLLADPDLAWEVLQRLAGKVAGPWEFEGNQYGVEWKRKIASARRDGAWAVDEGDAIIWGHDQDCMRDHEFIGGEDRAVDYAKGLADEALRAAGYVLAKGDHDG